MKIGFDAKRIFHNRTGLGNYSRDIIRIMNLYYPNNKYFLYNPQKSKEGLFVPNETNVHEITPNKLFDQLFQNFWRQINIVNDITTNKIDLYHGLSGEIPLNVKNINIPVVVTIHDLIFLRFPQFYSFFDRKIHKLKAYHACRNADIVIAVSKQTKNDILNYFKIPEEKVKVIYQGCQDIFKRKKPKEEIDRIKKKYGLPNDYILNVGTIEERKNILAAVKAIKDIDIHLAIVGRETLYTKKVRKYIERNNMTKKVSFINNISNNELAAIYQGALLFIYPSLFEGFGIPIIEAMYSGIPVITSKGGCFNEAGGENCIYINPIDIVEIRESIKNVLQNQQLREAMIKKGKDYVLKFSDKNIASQYKNLYQSLI